MLDCHSCSMWMVLLLNPSTITFLRRHHWFLQLCVLADILWDFFLQHSSKTVTLLLLHFLLCVTISATLKSLVALLCSNTLCVENFDMLSLSDLCLMLNSHCLSWYICIMFVLSRCHPACQCCPGYYLAVTQTCWQMPAGLCPTSQTAPMIRSKPSLTLVSAGAL